MKWRRCTVFGNLKLKGDECNGLMVCIINASFKLNQLTPTRASAHRETLQHLHPRLIKA